MRAALAPLLAGLLGLAGTLAVTLSLHRAADAALERVLQERLRGAGETAASLLAAVHPDGEGLRAVMRASGLEGASLLSPALTVLADATGPAGGLADLLRVDQARVARALGGAASVDFGYDVGGHSIASGYFPVRGAGGAPVAVLVLEGGQSFGAERTGLRRALGAGIALSALVAVALAAAAAQWVRSEARRRIAAERAARGDALARMAAMVAHEIRNPLGIIRGAAELVGARSGPRLGAADVEALRDVLGEVERLNRLVQDFLDLAREPQLVSSRVDLAEVVAEAARGLARTHPSVEVRPALPHLQVIADPGRLRQVLGNVLLNGAQAGARVIELRGAAEPRFARLEIADDGPGIPDDLRPRLFDAFATGRAEGTGLGLAISRRTVERLGGTLVLVEGARPGATFALRLPLAAG